MKGPTFTGNCSVVCRSKRSISLAVTTTHHDLRISDRLPAWDNNKTQAGSLGYVITLKMNQAIAAAAGRVVPHASKI